MWQDLIVSVVAIGAAVVLGRRWFRPRAACTPSCPSCASGTRCDDDKS